ncbi:SigB/SigF/SigG family RNA polymerase sigma factor [Nocardia tengchongensis]|uniref:SigB/SigF/SigG family RNA polymerase sigma factor n=1 Tax=Nocardia tengchongensis TaxID=2055889 RepID=UPI00365A7D77
MTLAVEPQLRDDRRCQNVGRLPASSPEFSGWMMSAIVGVHRIQPDSPRQVVCARPPSKKRSDNSYDNIEPLLVELARYEVGDVHRTALRQDVIERCLPLAEHIARKFADRGENFEDLVQVARVGLLSAADRFDPTRGKPFLAFAVPTIVGEIRRYFRDCTWAVRVPRRVKEVQQQLGPATESLMHRLGRLPKAGELATELGVDLAVVTQALVAGNAYRTTPIDAVTEHESSIRTQPLSEILGDEDPSYRLVDDYLAVKPLIAALPERERRVLVWRYFESRTQLQIARQLGISQIQVSRILAETLERLRENALHD